MRQIVSVILLIFQIFGDVYEFVHTGISSRRERAAFKKTLHLTRDPRVSSKKLSSIINANNSVKVSLTL